jgi:hypothetical protein
MAFHRMLQVAGALALVSTLHLVWQASPAGPAGTWQAGRLLYAGAGAVSALSLIAIGHLGVELARVRATLARIEARLPR